MPYSRITGTGVHFPQKVLTNADLEKLCDTNDEWIQQRTGIKQRYCAAPGEGSSDLALPAARQALDNAGLAPDDLEMIIFCTLTPDVKLPAAGNLLQGSLGANNAASFDLNCACSGFLNGLAVADSFIRAGQYRNILLVGSEVATNLLTWEFRDTAVLFGDGAGAVVMQATDEDRGVRTVHLATDGVNYEILYLPKDGSREPINASNVNDHPFRIYMDGRELFKRAVVKMVEYSQKALDATGLTIDDIALFVPHQANARILEATAQRLNFPMEKTIMNIDHAANTIAATIPIALHEAVEDGRVKDGDHILFASFGAGLSWGSAIVKW